MIAPDATELLMALLAGVGLGLGYFGGLWLTVRRLPDAKRPEVLSLSSLMLRLGLVVLGFYLLMDGHWERLLASVAGFLLARTALVRRLRPDQTGPSTMAR